MKLIDNKAVKNPVSKVSALEKNLVQNLEADIAQIEAWAAKKGVPPEVAGKALPKLKGALADLKAYMDKHPNAKPYSQTTQQAFKAILDQHGIDRVVTFTAGGARAGISQGLGKKGFEPGEKP